MRIYILLLSIALGGISVSAQEEKAVDLEALYREIDQAIDNSPNYVKLRENDIQKAHNAFSEASTDEQRLVIAEQLFWLFKPYKNDSALHYAQQCIDLAETVDRKGQANRFRSLMARQCSNAGMYVEASGILQQVDKETLDRQGLTDYYDACMHVCGEVAAYTLIPKVRDFYFAERDHYRDSLLEVVDPASDNYLHIKISALCDRKEFQEALRMSDAWLNKTREGTHEDAYAAYYRHIIYANLGNHEKVIYWLGKSALDDIKCAVMDQAALIGLAEQLNIDGDLKRSYKYISFTWQCNSFFNTRMRAGQISPVLNVIERNYKASIDRNTHLLIVIAVIAVLLTILFLAFVTILRSQKKKLAHAREELQKKNEELEASNHKLHWMNERMVKNNKQLFEINHRLQEEKNGLMGSIDESL